MEHYYCIIVNENRHFKNKYHTELVLLYLEELQNSASRSDSEGVRRYKKYFQLFDSQLRQEEEGQEGGRYEIQDVISRLDSIEKEEQTGGNKTLLNRELVHQHVYLLDRQKKY